MGTTDHFERRCLKDRIIDNVSDAVKQIQRLHVTEGDSLVLRNDDPLFKKLVEHLDHAFLHGIKKITGYWFLVKDVTPKAVVQDIEDLTRVSTALGKGRAWLYLCLQDHVLESYLKCVVKQTNKIHKLYHPDAILQDSSIMQILITLTAGVENINFDLQLDVDSLDLCGDEVLVTGTTTMPTSASEDLIPEDRISLHSVTSSRSSLNRLAVEDAIDVISCADLAEPSLVTVSEQGADLEVIRCPVKTTKKKNRRKPKTARGRTKSCRSADGLASTRSIASVDSLGSLDSVRSVRSDQRRLSEPDSSESGYKSVGESDSQARSARAEGVASASNGGVARPLHPASSTQWLADIIQQDELHSISSEVMDSSDSAEHAHAEPGVGDHRNTAAHAQEASTGRQVHPSALWTSDGIYMGGSTTASHTDYTQTVLRTDSLCTATTPTSHRVDTSTLLPAGSLRTGTAPSHRVDTSTLLPPDHLCTGTSAMSGTSPAQFCTGASCATPVSFLAHPLLEIGSGSEIQHSLQGDDPAMLISSGSEEEYPGYPMDNNTKLIISLEFFKGRNERFVKAYQTSVGHTDGQLQAVYVIVSDQSLYIINRSPLHDLQCLAAVTFRELDYISLSLCYQALNLVCINRRKQFWITTGDQQMTRSLLSVLDSTIRQSPLAIPILSLLTDATTQRIALKKWLSEEFKCQRTEVTLLDYSLVHWRQCRNIEDWPQPPTELQANLLYRMSPDQAFKPAFCVVAHGSLHIFANRKCLSAGRPLLSIKLDPDQVTGCRYSRQCLHPHTLEVLLPSRKILLLSCYNNQQASNWLQALCYWVHYSTESQADSTPDLVPCCLVLTTTKLLTCHEDVQTNFMRTLAASDIIDITKIFVPSAADKRYCILNIDSPNLPTAEHWELYFNTSHQATTWLRRIQRAWCQLYQVEFPVIEIEDHTIEEKCCRTLKYMDEQMTVLPVV